MVVRLKTDCDAICRQMGFSRHKDLTPGNYYRVVALSYRSYRLMSDDGGPYLYETELFDMVSNTRPADWVSRVDAKGREVYAGPACFSEPGFFEAYFDGDKKARRTVGIRLAAWGWDGEDCLVNDGTTGLQMSRESTEQEGGSILPLKISDDGLHIPKELLAGWKEVEIRRENGSVFIRPVNQKPHKLSETELLAEYRQMAADEEHERAVLNGAER